MKTELLITVGLLASFTACGEDMDEDTDDKGTAFCQNGGMQVVYDSTIGFIADATPGIVSVDFEAPDVFWYNCADNIRIYKLVGGQRTEFQDDLHVDIGPYSGVYLDGEYICPVELCDDIACRNNGWHPGMRIAAIEIIKTGTSAPPEGAERCYVLQVPTEVETYESRPYSGRVVVEVDVFTGEACLEADQRTCSAELDIP